MGYYSGVKEGLDTLSQDAQRTQQTALYKANTDTANYDLQQKQAADEQQDRGL